jgi:hypothetical protein
MSAMGRTRAWLRAVVRRGRLEREMHAEMAAHIAQAADRFMARGMSERDALLAARREFGRSVRCRRTPVTRAVGSGWTTSIAI